MKLEDIEISEQLGQWLADKPIDWAQVVAARVALRALPWIGEADGTWLSYFAEVAQRAVVISWVARNYPSHDMAFAIDDAASAANHFYDVAASQGGATLGAFDAFLAAKHAIFANTFYSGSPDHEGAINNTEFVVEIANGLFAEAAPKLWRTIRADCEWLATRDNRNGAARALIKRGLGLEKIDPLWRARWDVLAAKLLDIDAGYTVWIDWYERRIRGERAAFDIPGDKGRIEDKKILRRLAEATDEDFWGKGHEYVNATLKGWLEEARASAGPQPYEKRSPKQTAETLLQQASPLAQISDGKLDAAPNTTFDKPQYSDNLAELPSELLAYTNTILNSLPPNCAAIVRNCFTGFRDEMLVRGNRPILNILKAMAASLTAELYGNPPADTSPDEWQLRDPREWGDGFHSMFGHFFKGYHDLIHHFPLDTEREEFIAATPIDEMAASGEALTGPVDAVAALILDLGKQGFATDNIVRIVEAHQIYNRDIAQLPSSGADSNVVTPKRRHVLATAGFYLNTYSVLGTTASLYALQTVPAVQALMPKLKAAADALLAFIR